MKLLYGDSAARLVSQRIAAPVADMTALKAQPSSRLVDGMYAHVLSDDSLWQYDGTSVLTNDNILVARPSDGVAGAWLRAPGGVKLVIPGLTFATADAAILFTFQAGQELHLQDIYWDVTADWTGGASSTIGVSSSNKTNFTTKGDILGGAAGSLAAALTAAATPNFGTVGAGYDTIAKRRVLFKSTDTLRHDRITSAFVAGTANLVLIGNLIKNLGA